MTTAPSAYPDDATRDQPPRRTLPEIDLRQLQRMSDDTGIFQHAVHGVPDLNHGYCIDDNARALIAALLHAQLRGHDERSVPLSRYLGFLAYAYNEQNQRFRNFMGYDRRWLEDQGSQDSQARTYWALGLTVQLAPSSDLRELARNLFLRSLPVVKDFGYIRSWAFALIGLCHFLEAEPDHTQCVDLRDVLATRLFDRWRAEADDDWPWWNETVTYDNAKLCHALLLAGRSMGRPEMTAAGLRSLSWLIDQQTVTGDDGSTHLSIIGNDGWLKRGKPRARFDQQPLEAYALADACLTAARCVDDPQDTAAWTDRAWWCFEWFTGRNDLNTPLYHADTGGCQDGLQPDGPNKNQGAESILAYLLTVLELHKHHAPAGMATAIASSPFNAGVPPVEPAPTSNLVTNQAKISERDWVKSLLPSLQSVLANRLGAELAIEVIDQHRLAYANEIDGYIGDQPKPSRRTGYTTDVLIREVDGREWVPRVVIETKLGQVTTHDALTYSAKAATHKQVHPYLRYGILIGNWGDYPLPPRLLRHGAHFDFMMTWRSLLPTQVESERFLSVLIDEIKASRQLQQVMNNNRRGTRATYHLVHRPLILE